MCRETDGGISVFGREKGCRVSLDPWLTDATAVSDCSVPVVTVSIAVVAMAKAGVVPIIPENDLLIETGTCYRWIFWGRGEFVGRIC